MNNIRFDREYPTLGKLKANLIALVSKYYPSGVIEIGDIYTGNVRLCAYIPDDPDYGVLNMTVIGDSIATVGDVMKKDTNPKARAFIDAFNKAKANTEAKKSAPAQPKGIRLLNTHLLPTDGNLGNDLVELAKRYYPDGELEIGSKSNYSAIRFTGYYPDNKEFAPIEIASRREVICEVTTSHKHRDNPKARAFIDAFNQAKANTEAKKSAPVQQAQPVQPVQAPAKPVAPPAHQAPTQSIPKNYRRIDSSKRKLYHVAGQFYPPYEAVIVAIGDSPKNSEIYTEDGSKFYLGVKRYKLLQQGARAGLQITPINPNNPASKMALAYYKIALV